jgi:cholesterol transport system auxiliary component
MRYREGITKAMQRLMIPAVVLLLAGCSIGPPAKDPPATYDLGAQAAGVAVRPSIRATLLIPPVVAPVWLDHAGIAYRLGYHDSARHQVYANSRWVAAPAALLTQRLRGRFAAVSAGVVAGAEGVRSDYALHVELDDFSQFFDTPATSRVSVSMRASLVQLGDRSLRAQRSFSVSRPAAPDAAGAVAGLSDASDALIRELLEWTARSLGANPPADERSPK